MRSRRGAIKRVRKASSHIEEELLNIVREQEATHGPFMGKHEWDIDPFDEDKPGRSR